VEIGWTVSEEQQGLRLRQVLRQQYCLSRRQLIRLKQLTGTVIINGQPAPLIQRLTPGDRVEIILAEHLEQQPPEEIPLEIIYEDHYLIVVNKSAGLVSHPTKGYPGGTLANALSWHWQQQGEEHPARLVTRLDKDTSGLVLAAKNAWTHYRLSESEIVKKYYGITQGIPVPLAGEINLPVGRSEDSGRRGCTPSGKPALTRYWTEATGESLALVRLEPVTGRTHQLRIHMAHMGCPLLDDYLYGNEEGLVGRTALHASSLEFSHPVSKQELHFSVDLPEDMKAVVRDKIIYLTSI
jgi:23S rRNA pseudouridine1911/1915/1917 synthase